MEKKKKKWRISSFLNRTKDEYILWLKYIADQNFTFEDIIIGSVVPDITQELKPHFIVFSTSNLT